ncbi:HTH domain-containing protein [Streptomyces atratus]|nr:HTH domain-containing protein [Streptomyces atratus]MCX5340330.1 helix-turn-helix domain-containing protein [Streptomyces atratus]
MQAKGAKVTGTTLAERLGCSVRSGYRYLGEVQAA